MTQQTTPAAFETGTARNSLVAGLTSVVLAAVYMLTPVGVVVLIGCTVFGLAGLVLGILALKKGQPKGWAITGLIAGTLGFLFGLAVVLFAFAFVGVFSA